MKWGGNTRSAGKLLMVLAGLAVALVWAAPAQAGWGPDFRVSESPGFGDVESGQVAALPEGGFIYVWNAPDEEGALGVFSRVSRPGGALGPVTVVAEGIDTGDLHDLPKAPSVAAGADGTIRAVWTREFMNCSLDCDYWSVAEMITLDEDGRPAGTAQAMDSTSPGSGSYIGDISLSVAEDGNALAAWKKNQVATSDIVAATAEPGDTAEIHYSLNSALQMGDPKAAAKSGGGGFLAVPFQGADAKLEGMMIAADGSATPHETLATGPGEPKDVTALIDSTGKGTAVFQQSVDGTGDMWMRQMNPAGSPLGSGPVKLSNEIPLANSWAQDAAVGPGDEIVVLWAQPDEPDDDERAWVRPVSPAGVPGTSARVNPTSGDIPWAKLALAPSGGGFAAYIEFDGDSGELKLDVRELGPGYVPTGSPSTILESDLFEGIEDPDLAIDLSGEASVTWQGQDPGGPGYHLFSSIFEETAPELEVSVPPKAAQGQEIEVRATATDRNPVSVTWDFGDGGTAQGTVVRHTYATAGTFQVRTTATDAAGNATTVSTRIEVVAKDGPGPPPDQPVKPVPPQTKITGKPAKKTKRKSASFRFVSSLSGSAFQCRLDKARWKPCASPKKLKKLKSGKHTFRVRAIRDDLTDATPASYRWTVKRAKRARR